MNITAIGFVLLLLLSLIGCSNYQQHVSNMTAAREAKKGRLELRANIKKIEPFFAMMGKPGTSDWLASHNEPGQTFAEYLEADPVKPTAERSKIYVLPLGTFTAKQRKIIAVTAGYLGAFYDLPVTILPVKSMPKPTKQEDHRTLHQIIRNSGKFPPFEQIRTGYINESILQPILPKDGAALLGLTNEDLFPDQSMNYVFGQASLENRVGVWSLARLGETGDYETFLLRTLKIAAHETGHMFSMRHCAKYECLMSGTNHLAETDRRPIDACPECTAKICWLSDADQKSRYERLATFMKQNNFPKESITFTKKADAL